MCMSDGYHPNELGMKKMLEFIRTHGYAEVGPWYSINKII